MTSSTDHDLLKELELELPSDLLALERQLCSMVPARLASSAMARLDRVASTVCLGEEGVCEELANLEQHLGKVAPSAMPEGMLSRMAEAMDRWHEGLPLDEKVVLFEEAEKEMPAQRSTAKQQKASRGGMVAAAAAVALLGAVTALMLPRNDAPTAATIAAGIKNSSTKAEKTSVAVMESPSVIASTVEPRDTWLLPDSLSHQVTHTSDRGVVLSGDSIPHRCIQVDYVEKLKAQAEDGSEIELERPAVEYYLIPVDVY